MSRGSFGSWCSVGSRGLELIGRRVGSPGSLRSLPLLRLIHRARTSAFRGRPPRGGGAVSLLSGRGLGRAGLGSPGTRGPACAALRCAAHQRVCGQRRLSACCAGAGERSCGSPRPFMHLGFGPPFGKLNIKAQEERGPASGYSREGRFLFLGNAGTGMQGSALCFSNQPHIGESSCTQGSLVPPFCRLNPDPKS